MKKERTISMASPMEAYESERLNASYPMTVLWNPMEEKLSLRIHIQCVLLWSLMRTLQRQGPPSHGKAPPQRQTSHSSGKLHSSGKPPLQRQTPEAKYTYKYLQVFSPKLT